MFEAIGANKVFVVLVSFKLPVIGSFCTGNQLIKPDLIIAVCGACSFFVHFYRDLPTTLTADNSKGRVTLGDTSPGVHCIGDSENLCHSVAAT